MTRKAHLEFLKNLMGSGTLVVPEGTEQLPLAEKLQVYLWVFESGCSVTQLPCGDGKPESCPECVRAFVDAVKGAVDKEIADDPLESMKRLCGAVNTKPVQ